MNRILAFFGLMKIKRAKNLTGLLYINYVNCVLNKVKEDFGAHPIKNVIKLSQIWWDTEFDAILKHNSNHVIITSEQTFNK